jgi:hypothetical protein
VANANARNKLAFISFLLNLCGTTKKEQHSESVLKTHYGKNEAHAVPIRKHSVIREPTGRLYRTALILR